METRSKKKCKLPAEKDEGTSLNSAREYNLPPEIMEMIIGYLQEDAQELMKYRLVNSYWASVLKTYIERKILSNWMSWTNGFKRMGEPLLNIYINENPPEPFPLLSLVSAATFPNARSAAVYTPLRFGDNVNPFPTGSLTIRMEPLSYCEAYDQKMQKWIHSMEPRKVEKLLCNFGEHLTSFVFQDATVTFSQLESIVKSLVNLKAFTISKLKLRKSSQNLVGSQTSLISTRLTHVQAVQQVAPQIIQWLVDRCAHQLISLEVDASELMPFRQPTTPSSSPAPYQKLKYLKLYNPSCPFFHLTDVFPLKRLCLIHDKAQPVDKLFLKIEDFGKFWNKSFDFSIYLKLYCEDCARLRLELWGDTESVGEERMFDRAFRNIDCPTCS